MKYLFAKAYSVVKKWGYCQPLLVPPTKVYLFNDNYFKSASQRNCVKIWKKTLLAIYEYRNRPVFINRFSAPTESNVAV